MQQALNNVYVLQLSNGKFYVGRTADSESRIRLHILGPVRPPERQGPEVQELRLDQDNVAYVGIQAVHAAARVAERQGPTER